MRVCMYGHSTTRSAISLLTALVVVFTGSMAMDLNVAEAVAPNVWQTQGPFPSGISDILDLACPSIQDCYAVGVFYSGNPAIVATTDSGATWTSLSVPAGITDVSAISCPSTLTCYVVATFQQEVLVTTDGGAMWTIEAVTPALGNNLYGIACPTLTECFTVGGVGATQSGGIFGTTNGGMSWTDNEYPPTIGIQYSVACPSPSDCFSTGVGIVATTNSGASWGYQGTPSPAAAYKSVTCPSTSTCYAVAFDPLQNNSDTSVVVNTTDGGAQWNQFTFPTGFAPTGWTHVISCTSATTCYVVGPTNVMLGTNDSGQSWSQQVVPAGFAIGFAISCVSPSCVVIASNASQTSLEALLGPAHGYWLVGSDGGIFNFGSAQFDGSAGSLHLQRPVVGISQTSDRRGYWLDASDGGIFAYGDAGFFGSIPGLGLRPADSGLPKSLSAPIVGMVPSADSSGYFLVASDGGVFAFGDAKFEGSCYSVGGCAGAAVAVMPDASGKGYWLVTKTGNVYAFGDAQYFGGLGGTGSSVTSAVRSPSGHGYWVLTANGDVYAYGDALYQGGPSGQFGGLNPATAIFATSDGGGYWIASANGSVYSYGDAPFDGSMAGSPLNGAINAAAGF